MHRLALTIVLTSQGIPFLHAGSEFLRNKQGVENSYKSSDSINELNWHLKKENLELNIHVQKLLKMRREHPAFRMLTADQVSRNIIFDNKAPQGTIIYSIDGKAMNDNWKRIWIAFNGTDAEKNVGLPAGNWKTAINTEGNEPIHAGHMHLKKYSAIVLYEE